MTQGDIPGVEDVDVLEVNPQRVLFLVDRYSTKVIYSIRPVFVYDSTKTQVDIQRISPRTVRVKGPRSILRTLRYVVTDSIYIDTLKTGTHSINVYLESPRKSVQILKPRMVKVTFSLVHFLIDTIPLPGDGTKFIAVLRYPDTLSFSPDSLICREDTVKKIPHCSVPEGVILLDLIKNREER